MPLLYARSQFKLFMATALGDLDLRRQTVGLGDRLFLQLHPPHSHPRALRQIDVDGWPHQDDETIGCGGALALQVRSGNAASIVIVQDGADGHEELGHTPADSGGDCVTKNPAAPLPSWALSRPAFSITPVWRKTFRKPLEELRRILIERKVDAVFTPFLLDGHPDHRTTNEILAAALQQIPWDVRVFGYEVWGLCIPNVLVIIDEVMEDKLKMLSCFTFANKAIDYVHTTKGLNMYRSRLLGAGECRYAECFFEVPRAEFIELVNRIRNVGANGLKG